MYPTLLVLHSVLRWIVLGLILTAAVRAARRQDAGRIEASLLYSLWLQAALGVALFVFASPTVADALADMGAAMKAAPLRFWAVEHPTMMVLGSLLAGLGAWRSRAGGRPGAVLGLQAVALLLLLAGIPWPFREGIGRGLLPF